MCGCSRRRDRVDRAPAWPSPGAIEHRWCRMRSVVGWLVRPVDTGRCATTSAARGRHVTAIEQTAHLVAEFSDSDATALPWSEVVRALESSEMFWLSTVRRDGRPHVAPLPAMWWDGKLHFCTGAHEQKAKNIAQLIRADGHATGVRSRLRARSKIRSRRHCWHCHRSRRRRHRRRIRCRHSPGPSVPRVRAPLPGPRGGRVRIRAGHQPPRPRRRRPTG
jgi:hypothetical protein